MTTYTNPADEAAINAATDQTAQCTTAVGFFAGNVTRKIYAADGTTHLATLTHGPFTVGGVTQKRLVAGAKLAQTHIAAGVAAYIAECDGATERFRGPVALTYPVTEGWPIDLTDHPAWVANPALPLAPPAPSAVDVSGFSAASIALTPVGGSLETITFGPANRIADFPADAISPAHAVYLADTSDPAVKAVALYCPAHLDGLPYRAGGPFYVRTDVGTLGSTISSKAQNAPKELDATFNWGAGSQTIQYRQSPTGAQAFRLREGMIDLIESRSLPARADWRAFVQRAATPNNILPAPLPPARAFNSTSPTHEPGAKRMFPKYINADQGGTGERVELGIICNPAARWMGDNGVDSSTSEPGLTHWSWFRAIADEIARVPWATPEPGKLRPIHVNDAQYADLIFIVRTGSPIPAPRGYFVGDPTQFLTGFDAVNPDTQHPPAGLAEYAVITGSVFHRWALQRQAATLLGSHWGGTGWTINGRRRCCFSPAGRDAAWALRTYAYAHMLAPTADSDFMWGKAKWMEVINDHLDYGQACQAESGNWQKAPFAGVQDYTVGGTAPDLNSVQRYQRNMIARSYWGQTLAWLMRGPDAGLRARAAAVAQPMVEEWILRPASVDYCGMLAACEYSKTAGGTAYTAANISANFDDYFATHPAVGQEANFAAWKKTPYAGLASQQPSNIVAPGSYDYARHIRSVCQLLVLAGAGSWTAGGVSVSALLAVSESEYTRLNDYTESRYNFGDGSNIV